MTEVRPDEPGAGSHGRSPALNALVSAVANVLGKVSTLAWTVVAARVLTQEDFGTFNLILAVVLIASALAEAGFDPVLIRKGSVERDQLPRYHSEALVWQLGLALPLFLFAGAALWAARPEEDARIAVAFMALAILLDLWSDTARASATAAQDQRGVSGALVLQRLAAAALMVPALLAGLGLVGMSAGFLAASAIGWAAHVTALRRLGVGFRRRLVDIAGLRAFGRGTWSLAVSSIVFIALFRIDTLILAALKGDQAVGEYAAAYRVFETVLFVVYAVTGAVSPGMSAQAHEGEPVRRLGELSLLVLFACFAPFAAVCLAEAESVLRLLYGPRYEDAAGAVQWLALAPLVYGTAAVGGAMLVSVGRTGGLLVGAVAALVVNVALNLALVPSMAGTGAALATTAAYAVEAAVTLVFVARVVPPMRLGAPVVESLVAAGLVTAALAALPLPLLLELPPVLALYAGGWLAWMRARRPERLDAIRIVLLRRPAAA